MFFTTTPEIDIPSFRGCVDKMDASSSHENKEHSDHLRQILDVKASWEKESFPCSQSKPSDLAGWKLIHFVRHGQGTHNALAAEVGSKAYQDERVTDARLTDLGRKQAEKSQDATAQMGVELVCTSPLSRAVETALLAFQDASNRDVDFIAHENLREQIGQNVCDQRRSITELQGDFSSVNFSLLLSEHDKLWTPERETKNEVATRGWEFLHWVMARPEQEIAVVCHSSFLLTLFNVVLKCDKELLQKWFETGEIRSVYVRGVHDAAHGGEQKSG